MRDYYLVTPRDSLSPTGNLVTSSSIQNLCLRGSSEAVEHLSMICTVQLS